ncbi:MAG: CRISPR-associated endonuclease Cas3'' [Pseudomonadota bacterium]
MEKAFPEHPCSWGEPWAPGRSRGWVLREVRAPWPAPAPPPARLLAKSCARKGSPRVWDTLTGHALAVADCVELVLSRLLARNSRPRALDGQEERFSRLCRFCAVLHDLGKATDLFQGLLGHGPGGRAASQPVRHELLSSLLVGFVESPARRAARSLLPDRDLWIAGWVLGGHHLRLDDPLAGKGGGTALVNGLAGPRVLTFYGSHPDVAGLFDLASSRLETRLSAAGTDLYDVSLEVREPEAMDEDSMEDLVFEYLETSRENAARWQEDRELAALAKAVLVGADAAASAVARKGGRPVAWLSGALGHNLDAPALASLASHTRAAPPAPPAPAPPANSAPEPDSVPVSLVLADRGEARASAALAWASDRAVGRKLFLCHPTTGEATSEFSALAASPGGPDGFLVHARAGADLSRMAESPEEDFWETSLRLESLAALAGQVVCASADAVLGLVQNHRRGLFLFPALAGAAFVFHEIHAYSDALFGALLRFLETFGRHPVLLLAPALTPGRLRALRRSLGGRLSGPEEAGSGEGRASFFLERSDPRECLGRVTGALGQGERVLWVCNTVAQAVRVFETARDLGLSPLLFHSRFRYRDREARREEAVARLAGPGPALVVATQACEAGLSRDCGLLVTEACPLPSLVRRLENLGNDLGRPGTCLVLEPAPGLSPYGREELSRGGKALDILVGRPVGSRDLAGLLAFSDRREPDPGPSAWLDGFWSTGRRSLRLGPPSVAVVMERDLAEIRRSLAGRLGYGDLVPWTVPLPFRAALGTARRLGGIPVAPDRLLEYDKEKGALWRWG